MLINAYKYAQASSNITQAHTSTAAASAVVLDSILYRIGKASHKDREYGKKYRLNMYKYSVFPRILLTFIICDNRNDHTHTQHD